MFLTKSKKKKQKKKWRHHCGICINVEPFQGLAGHIRGAATGKVAQIKLHTHTLAGQVAQRNRSKQEEEAEEYSRTYADYLKQRKLHNGMRKSL